MTYYISAILSLLILIGCGKSGGGSSGGDTGQDISLEEIESSSEVPTAALTFDTDIRTYGFESTEEAKIIDAAELIRRVVTSENFKSKILNYKYKGKKTFVDNGGLSNAQIYKKILEAAETLSPVPNNTMDLEIVLYQASNNTVGYTYPDESKIWMNDKYFKARTPAEVTTNMVHEWLHKLGFKHSQSSTPSRPYSVPYAIGYLVRDLAKQLD